MTYFIDYAENGKNWRYSIHVQSWFVLIVNEKESSPNTWTQVDALMFNIRLLPEFTKIFARIAKTAVML